MQDQYVPDKQLCPNYQNCTTSTNTNIVITSQQTNIAIQANRADIIILDKKGKEVQLIDILVPVAHNLRGAFQENNQHSIVQQGNSELCLLYTSRCV